MYQFDYKRAITGDPVINPTRADKYMGGVIFIIFMLMALGFALGYYFGKGDRVTIKSKFNYSLYKHHFR